MAYHRVCNNSNATGTTSGAGNAYTSTAHEFTLVFGRIRVAQSYVLCVVLLLLGIVLSELPTVAC
jgi:hypothetical protein